MHTHDRYRADHGRQLQVDYGGAVGLDHCLAAARLGSVAITGAVSIWIQLRGQGWVESREGRFRLEQGSYLLLERDSSPQVQADAGALCIGVAVDARAGYLLEQMADRVLYAGHGGLTRSQTLTALRLWREAVAAGGDARAVRPLLLHVAGAQDDLLARVQRCPGRSRSHKRQVFARLQRARLYLEGHSDRMVRIGELAELANFSPWYFSKAFHTTYDESPQTLAARLRVERAAGLLRESEMMIGEVAAASGFENCCSFARAFRARFGMSASGYRDQLTDRRPVGRGG